MGCRRDGSLAYAAVLTPFSQNNRSNPFPCSFLTAKNNISSSDQFHLNLIRELTFTLPGFELMAPLLGSDTFQKVPAESATRRYRLSACSNPILSLREEQTRVSYSIEYRKQKTAGSAQSVVR
jgi:hypothetical protein